MPTRARSRTRAVLWLFEDAANEGWIKPSGSMLGNGMGWGQLSHTLAWVLRVTGLVPVSVYAEMLHSESTGADLFDAAIIRCASGALINMQARLALALNRDHPLPPQLLLRHPPACRASVRWRATSRTLTRTRVRRAS